MKSARNQLILLGFICQGLSWENSLLTLGYAFLWWACVTIPRRPIVVSPAGEILLLVAGAAGGYYLSIALGESAHFFIGHGLALLQAARLLRPLERREKVFAIFAALVQIGVGCTIILDYRFLLILTSALFLIPRVFSELELETFATPIQRAREPIGFLRYSTVASIMVTLFLVFPRGLLGPGLPANMIRGGAGSLEQSLLDPTQGGRLQSGKVLLQVDAQELGYLRSVALTHFDGTRWTSDRRPRRGSRRQTSEPLRPARQTDLAKLDHRRVRVKHVTFLGRILPTDGYPVEVRGKFFRDPQRDENGIVFCSTLWNTRNNLYEYWTDPDPPLRPLSPEQIDELTPHPTPSPRLTQWLDEQLAGISDPYEQARRLEDHLRDEFTYRIGAPKLDRINHIDDFIFNQREGHCERFASTLALLLRMKGIPTRVVLGYMPNQRNWLSGWYDIRFRDGHAWTEAYIPEKGWILLDATPRASYTLSSPYFSDFIDALDVVWYMHIVNFDTSAQRELFTVSWQGLAQLPAWAEAHSTSILFVVLPTAAFLIWYTRRPGLAARAGSGNKTRPAILAEHYYAQMLRLLRQRGIEKEPAKTPLEFLNALQSAPDLPFMPIQRITHSFCEVKYGNRPMTPQDEASIQAALNELRQASRAPKKSAYTA